MSKTAVTLLSLAAVFIAAAFFVAILRLSVGDPMVFIEVIKQLLEKK